LRLFTVCVFSLLLVTCRLAWAGDNSLLAEQLDRNSLLSLRGGGVDAIAGIGDWLLSNGTLCAVISDIDHETGLSASGGSLVDLGLCQKNNDQWVFNHLMPNMDKALILKPVSITARVDEGDARLTVVARGNGLQSISIYRLNKYEPGQLFIEHELQCLPGCPAISMLGILTLHPHRVLTPYTLSTITSSYARGFHHPAVDRFDSDSQLAAMLPNDVSILVGAQGLGASISYGVQIYDAYRVSPRQEKMALPIFSITDPDYTLQGVLSRQPWIGGDGKLGKLEMLQSLLMRFEEGEKILLNQRIVVAESADVAGISNQLYRGRELHGVVDNKIGRLSVTYINGEPITEINPASNGSFSLIIPAAINQVVVDLLTPWGAGPSTVVAMNAESVNMGHIQAVAETYLQLSATSSTRITVKGIDVEDPKFSDDLAGFSIGDKALPSPQTTNTVSLAGDRLSSGLLPVKPGRYQVLASRGLEYGVTIREVNIKAGESMLLEVAEPAREINSPGYLAADFHVHSGLSFDSSLPVAERLRSFAAQGGEVLIATEHNRLADLSIALQEHQLNDDIAIMPGVELTGMVRSEQVPYTHGHQNIFPMTMRAGEFSGGLPKHEGRRLRDLIKEGRAHANAVFQLNHPRDFDDPDPDLAYFENLLSGDAYNSRKHLQAAENLSLIEPDPLTALRDIDIDLIEVANGNNYAMYQAVREDWFSLLSQGEKVYGSANSDSHGSNQLVALPVNYVAFKDDRIVAYQQEEFLQSVRGGNFFGTTGPLLALKISSNEGDTALLGGQLGGQNIRLQLTVSAASWVPVERLNIYVNGSLDRSLPIEIDELIDITFSFERDSYIVVEVDAEPGPVYQILAPGFRPMAFSNPVFIDADNDGRWQPPGLPAMP